MEKWRLSVVRNLAPGHSSGKRWRCDLNPGLSALKQTASIVFHWVRILTLGPQWCFLSQVWPSWGTDPFGWKEGAEFSALCRLSRPSPSLAGSLYSMRGGGKSGLLSFLNEIKPYMLFCNVPFFSYCFHVCAFNFLKLCSTPLYR